MTETGRSKPTVHEEARYRGKIRAVFLSAFLVLVILLLVVVFYGI